MSNNTKPRVGLEGLRATVQELRYSAQGRMRDDRPRFWPDVSDTDFEAVLVALGEVSIVEAREALTRMQEEATKCRG